MFPRSLGSLAEHTPIGMAHRVHRRLKKHTGMRDGRPAIYWVLRDGDQVLLEKERDTLDPRWVMNVTQNTAPEAIEDELS